MKIAVLADIHGNSLALQKVLEDCQRFSIGHFFVLGDLIGYYYWPEVVLSLLAGLKSIDIIQGNHERMLDEALNSPQRRQEIQRKYGSGIEVAISKLSVSQKQQLINLPQSKIVEIDGLKFLLCHGAPMNADQYIYPNSEPVLFEQCAQAEVDCVFMGHTHYPFITYQKNIILANPGSVGQPRDVGSLASYFIIDTTNKAIVFRKVPFNPQRIVNQAKELDPDLNYLQDILLRNNAQNKESKHGLI